MTTSGRMAGAALSPLTLARPTLISSLIRRVIWELLGCPATDLPRLTDYIGQKQRQGKHRSEALHAASKKLIRTLWAMDRDQRPYDSARAHATR